MKTKNHLHTKGDYSINSWKLGNERKNSWKFICFIFDTMLMYGLIYFMFDTMLTYGLICFMFDTMLTYGRFAIYLRTMLTYLNMYDQLLLSFYFLLLLLLHFVYVILCLNEFVEILNTYKLGSTQILSIEKTNDY
jgi:hypothetical protein